MPQAGFHVGERVFSFCRQRCKNQNSKIVSYCNFFGTAGGAVAAVVPCSVADYRRLTALREAMVPNVAHNGGCNPAVYRTKRDAIGSGPGALESRRSRLNELRLREENVADGELLWQWLSYDVIEQRRLVQQMKAPPGRKPAPVARSCDQIIDCMLRVDLSTLLF